MVKPVIFIKLSPKDGSLVLKRYSIRKKSILHSLRREKWESAYVRVTYAPGFFNDGDYSSYQEALTAIQQFTEPSMVKEFYEKQNG